MCDTVVFDYIQFSKFHTHNGMTDFLETITLFRKFTLEQATKAQRWSRNIALLFP